LAGIVTYPEKDEVEQLIKGTALTAMIRVAKGLQAQSWPAEVHYDEEHTRAYLEVVSDQLDFLYEIRLREYLRPALPIPRPVRPQTRTATTTAPRCSCAEAVWPMTSTVTRTRS